MNTLLIACGALAREVMAVLKLNRLDYDLACLPAELHNTPARIPAAVRERIRTARDTHDRILVLYGDCGTGGELDRVLTEENVERLSGPHCYAMFRGVEAFLEEADADPTCFYLTDYLARHFDRLVVAGLGLDRHPELLPDYFGAYTKVVYFAQTDDPDLRRRAAEAAARLGLPLEVRETGYGELASFLAAA